MWYTFYLKSVIFFDAVALWKFHLTKSRTKSEDEIVQSYGKNNRKFILTCGAWIFKNVLCN